MRTAVRVQGHDPVNARAAHIPVDRPTTAAGADPEGAQAAHGLSDRAFHRDGVCAVGRPFTRHRPLLGVVDGVVVLVGIVRIAGFRLGAVIEDLVTFRRWKGRIVLVEHVERFVAGELEPVAVGRISSHLRWCLATPAGYRQGALVLEERELAASAGARSVIVHGCIGRKPIDVTTIDPLLRSAGVATP